MGIVGTDSDLGVRPGLKFYNENVRYQNVKQLEVSPETGSCVGIGELETELVAMSM